MGDYAVTNLRNALVTQIGTITTANNYKTNVRNVFDPPTDPERAQQFPIVNFNMTDEEDTNDYYQGNDELYDLITFVDLEFYFNTDNLPLAQDKAIGDVMKWCGTNYYVPNSDGNATAFMCKYQRSSRWGYKPQNGSKPNGGVTVTLRVHYRVNSSNPEVIR
jgi:hypothetical protein